LKILEWYTYASAKNSQEEFCISAVKNDAMTEEKLRARGLQERNVEQE
jgi:hypothetical protein